VHPVFTKNTRFALYMVSWVPVAALLALTLAVPARRTWEEAIALAASMGAGAAFLSLALWPVSRSLPLAPGREPQVIVVHAAAVLASCSMWLLIGAGVATLLELLPQFPGSFPRYRADVPLLFVIGSLLFALAALLNHLILAFDTARAAERSVLEVQVLARDAELRALRAQLNPHFLFNSLNAIGSLAGSDPARARQMTAQLAEFLRRSMTLGARREITLAEELELADRYLAVEQVRFGDRLRVERRVAPEALECRVPPLVLQPLVENAVTHGIAGLVDGGTIAIEARRAGSRLELAVENPFDPERPPRRGHGMGLENVRQRLATQQPGLTTVEAHEAFDRFRVDVRLPAEVDAPEPAVATLPERASHGA
jgi:hypothetical protein